MPTVAICLICLMAIPADEPFSIRSGFNQPYYVSSAIAFERHALETLGLGDELAQGRIAELNRNQAHFDERFRDQRGLNSHIVLEFLEHSGATHYVNCARTEATDTVARSRDEYLTRIGQGGDYTLHNDVTIVRGPTRRETEDGRMRRVSSWMPLYLWGQDDMLYSTSDAYILKLVERDELREPPSWVHSSPQFYISQPGNIPQSSRIRKLQEAFTIIGVHRQRRDGESLQDYNRRVATIEIWEQFLRSHYFQTSKLVARSAGKAIGKPVRFQFEVEAIKGTDLARLISSLKLHRSVPAAPNGIFCGSLNFELPPTLGATLSLAVREQLDVYMNDGGILSELCTRLKTGRVSGRWCVDQDTDGELAAMIEYPSNGKQASKPDVVEIDGIGVGDFGDKDLPFLVGLRTVRTNDHDRVLFEWRQASSAGIEVQGEEAEVSTILNAQFNLQKLASAYPGSTADLLYQWLETAYLDHGILEFRGRREDMPEDFGSHGVRRQLRKKILEGEALDWQATLEVQVDRQNARLTGTLTVGPRLLGFLNVANLYYSAIIARNSGHSAHMRVQQNIGDID